MYPSKYKKGFIQFLALIAIVSGTMLLMVGYIVDQSKKSRNVLIDDKKAYIKEVSAQLDSWYDRNAWVIDADVNAIPSATILTQSGVMPNYGLVIESSKRLTKDGIAYHVVAAYLPSSLVNNVTFDVDTGVFVAGTPVNEVQYAITNGYVIESKKVAKTANLLEKSASLLESWFYSKRDVAGPVELGNNWFRTPDCASPDARFIPCVDTYTDIASVMPSLGVNVTTGYSNAWAKPIFMINAKPPASWTPPYSIPLTTNLPWGNTMTGLAVIDH